MKTSKLILCYLIPFVIVLICALFFGGLLYFGLILLVLGVFQLIAGLIRCINAYGTTKQIPKSLKLYYVLVLVYFFGFGLLIFLTSSSNQLGIYVNFYLIYISSSTLIASYYLCEIVYSKKQIPSTQN